MRQLFLLLFLGACSTMNLSTLVQLNQLDPLTADPDGFVAAVVLPEGLDVPENGAQLDLMWVSGNETIGGSFPLRRNATLEDSAIEPDSGQRVLYFDLSPQDVANVRQAQHDISARKEAGEHGEGSFSVFATACAHGPVLVPRISTYLRIEDGGSFLPLLKDYDFRQDLSPDQILNVPQCP